MEQVKKYDVIIPMGYNCQCAFNINRVHHYLESNLFNWCFVKQDSKLLEVLKNPQLIFSEGYEYLKAPNMFECKRTNIVFHGKKSANEIYNENEIIYQSSIEQEYQDTLGRTKHLIEKFEKILKSESRKLFVYVIDTFKNVEDGDSKIDFINSLYEILFEKTRNFDLLIICKTSDYEFLLNNINSKIYLRSLDIFPPNKSINDLSKTDVEAWDKILSEFVPANNIITSNKVYKYEKDSKMKKEPKISVIMSCYNREKYVSEAIESILNQTFKDFEFIIIDDCSTDKSADIIEKYAQSDDRIVFIKNKKNKGLIYNLNKGLELSRGKYIARMDDDDISYPKRFEKQFHFMESNSDIAVCGTYIEIIGNKNAQSWINETDPEKLSVLMNFCNPMCHPTVMMRNEFLRKYNLKYNPKNLHAEEYGLWADVILNNGKFANLSDTLLQYRVHKNRITSGNKTSIIQYKNALKIRTRLLSRFFDKRSIKSINKEIRLYPFSENNATKLYKILKQIKIVLSKNFTKTNAIDKVISQYCGIPSNIDIVSSSSDEFSPHLATMIASILKNSLPFENFYFHIFDGGISSQNRDKILSLKEIKDFEIEFIQVDDNLFKDIKVPSACWHISKQTYYRYLIPELLPNLDKCLYLDSDIIVASSLNKLWNIELGDNYVAAVEDLCWECEIERQKFRLDGYFNAGVLLINNKLWRKENLVKIFFKNTHELQGKIRWADQDVLNYTFKNKVLFISPKFNLQQNAYFQTLIHKYSWKDIYFAKENPVIVHYNGSTKPWQKTCKHKLWPMYYDYVKYTKNKSLYYRYIIHNFVQNIFSIKNRGVHKVFTIFGISIKIKNQKLIEREKYIQIQNQMNILNHKIKRLEEKYSTFESNCNEVILK